METMALGFATTELHNWAEPSARCFPNPLFACIVSRLLLVRGENANGLSFTVSRLPAKRMVCTLCQGRITFRTWANPTGVIRIPHSHEFDASATCDRILIIICKRLTSCMRPLAPLQALLIELGNQGLTLNLIAGLNRPDRPPTREENERC
jgi:hypothetical protein